MLLLVLILSFLMQPATLADADPAPFDSTQVYYATQNAEGLKKLLAASDDRTIQLLCRYRLYPLTEEERYLHDLPTELANPTARDLALLSGLWGYKVMTGSVLQIPKHGLRASALLDKAKKLDPDDPFVLLIEGQSLLFRPALFGGDKQAALLRFRRLQDVLKKASDDSISPMEADLWVWYTLNMLKADEAATLRSRLLASNPPPLYRAFLLDPP